MGEIKHQKVESNKKGGYFVYKDVEDAIFSDIQFNHGGNYSAPRTILKCICWGIDTLRYGNKFAFSNIMPVEDIGLPIGYKANPQECMKQVFQDKIDRMNSRLEKKYDLNLVRLNNFSKEQYENNLFENYFTDSVIRQVEEALLKD